MKAKPRVLLLPATSGPAVALTEAILLAGRTRAEHLPGVPPGAAAVIAEDAMWLLD